MPTVFGYGGVYRFNLQVWSFRRRFQRKTSSSSYRRSTWLQNTSVSSLCIAPPLTSSRLSVSSTVRKKQYLLGDVEMHVTSGLLHWQTCCEVLGTNNRHLYCTFIIGFMLHYLTFLCFMCTRWNKSFFKGNIIDLNFTDSPDNSLLLQRITLIAQNCTFLISMDTMYSLEVELNGFGSGRLKCHRNQVQGNGIQRGPVPCRWYLVIAYSLCHCDCIIGCGCCLR